MKKKLSEEKSKQAKPYLFAMHNFSSFIYNKTLVLLEIKAVIQCFLSDYLVIILNFIYLNICNFS